MFQMFTYLKIALVIALVLRSFGMEITTCDCENPVFVGLIDSGEPDLCRAPLDGAVTDVVYEVIEQVEAPLTNIGFLCHQWLRQKIVTGFFFGGYDTVYQESPFETTADECRRMAETKECAGNKMVTNGRSSSFNAPPEGEGVWMDGKVYTEHNCEMESFNVTQECFNCPIESPFGILAANASSNKTSTRKGHLLYIWEKPQAHPAHCTYDIKRKGFGKIRSLYNSDGKVLRDSENQLEYIINGKPEKICNYDGCYRSEGLPNTFVRYSVREKTTVKPTTVATTTVAGTRSPLHQYFIVNTVSGLCLGTMRSPVNGSAISTEPCETARSETFLRVNDKLVSASAPDLCLSADDSTRGNRFVIFRKCARGKSSREDWKIDEEKGTFIANSLCLTLLSSSNGDGSTSYLVSLFACGELTNTVSSQTWKFVEHEKTEKRDVMMGDQAALIDEAAHHQFVEGDFIEIANRLNEEIRSVYCEAYRTKQFLALTLSQTSPMLAGRALGLPTCQRIQAMGQVMVIQQCKIIMAEPDVKKTKCGYEPKFGEFTVGYDGFTGVEFRNCSWSGIANLNGDAFEYVNDTWTRIQPNVKIATVGLTTHFDETIDNEAQYLQNLETSFHKKEIDQMNMLGELMSLMQHEDINSITPIVFHTQSESQFGSFSDWVFGLKMAGVVAVGLLLVYVGFRCVSCFTSDEERCRRKRRVHFKRETTPIEMFPPSAPFYRAAPPPPPTSPTPIPQPRNRAMHSHGTLRLSTGKGYVWEDGCPLILPSSPVLSAKDLDDKENVSQL